MQIAYAQAQSGATPQPPQPTFGPFWLLIAMFAVFYFFLLRPQQKREKQHRDFLQNLKANDMVVTAGGLHGRVVKVDDSNIIVLEVADKVRVKFSKNQIVGFSELAKRPEKKEKAEKSEDPEKPAKKKKN